MDGTSLSMARLTVGCLKNMMPPHERREMYLRDITYGQLEFGFDYLRDNMAYTPEDMVQQQGHHFAIVDEIDSILMTKREPPHHFRTCSLLSTQYSELQPAAARLVRRQRDLAPSCSKRLKRC